MPTENGLGRVFPYGGLEINARNCIIRSNSIWSHLCDMGSKSKIFGVLGCGGNLQLHFPNSKFALPYLVDSQNLAFLSEIRSVVLNADQTTCGKQIQ